MQRSDLRIKERSSSWISKCDDDDDEDEEEDEEEGWRDLGIIWGAARPSPLIASSR